ncbi:hypothetical protein AOCH_000136 [Aspergillus ochraceoroseus]|uniref:ATP phosphoribosyltransferase n=1 Tax=Aspergillus ochraceoroseus TaxID=138278 RepID=A0A0F8UP92_9EURO|nr:hypothetical protein AOCH_000136 [Aspergillus ochraceoroseus]
MATAKFKLFFHVPPAALEACKAAVFAAGAGRYPGPGQYTETCFVIPGRGQFRPGATANPNIGTPERWSSWRKCESRRCAAHPYEEVSYGVIRLEDF